MALYAIHALDELNGASISPRTDEEMSLLLCPGTAVFHFFCLLHYVTVLHLQWCTMAWHIGSCVMKRDVIDSQNRSACLEFFWRIFPNAIRKLPPECGFNLPCNNWIWCDLWLFRLQKSHSVSIWMGNMNKVILKDRATPRKLTTLREKNIKLKLYNYDMWVW